MTNMLSFQNNQIHLFLAITALCSISGTLTKGAEKEATLKDQLIVADPGPAFLASPTQAVFMPPMMKWQDWGYSPLWVNKPQPVSKDLPSTWKTKVHFDQKMGRSRAIVKFPKGTDLYGSGEVFGALRRNNTKIGIWNTDNYAYGTDGARRLYQSHPWMMGVREDGTAFGVIADTTWRATLEVTDTEIIFDSEGPVFPVIVLEGKTPQDVLTQLSERIGTIALPPLWSLGYQQSRFSYETAEKGLGIAREFRKRKIPADVIWMDIDYMDGYRVFTINKERFPDPMAYSKSLHKMNFKGVWMIDPGVKADPNYFVFQSGNENDVWVKKTDTKTDFVGPVWPGDCKFPDFTRAETRKWWASLYKKFIQKNGVDGIWNDMNEPAVFNYPGHTMPVNNHHRGDDQLKPGPHVQYHNIYGMMMMAATRDGMMAAQPDKRPFLLSRANFLGGHRYGATWTGDNCSTESHMKMSIPMNLNLGMSGQPFSGPDLGGFGSNASPDLFGQWVSFGVFFPFTRAHACKGTNLKEPWSFGLEVEEIARIAIQRKYRLIPYYYTLFQQSAKNGQPIMKPTFFADPLDKKLRDEQTTFLIGEDLLVIPTFARNSNLPSGNWKIFTLLNENKDANDKQATLKIRPGAIIPLGEVVQSTEEPMLETVTLIVNLDAQGKALGRLYQDSGDGYGYKAGDYNITHYSAEQTTDGIRVSSRIVEGSRPTATKKLIVRLLTSEGEKTAETVPGQDVIIK